jgi:hypothetical protein
MINLIIEYLPYLAIVVFTNFATGIYKSINIKKIKFDILKFLTGIIKMGIIVSSFIGTAYVYDKIGTISLGEVEISPDLIIIGAITMYLTKTMVNLKEILKIEKN